MTSTPPPEALFAVRWSRVRQVMTWIVVGVLAVHLYVAFTDELDLVGETMLRRLAGLDWENSFPTWLSAALMATSAVLCWVESRLTEAGLRRRWSLLGWGFLLLSVDEIAGFHGALWRPLQAALDLEGVLAYGWALPAIVGFGVAGVYFSPLLPSLPADVRRRVVTVAALFVTGAVGLELVSGALFARGSGGGWTYFAVATVEETVEIVAMFLFVDTMAMWLADRSAQVRISVNQT